MAATTRLRDRSDVESIFGQIMERTIARIPGAVGGAFAAQDGETVDSATEWDATEWQIFTAHFGIILHHVQSCLHTFHFGEAEVVIMNYREMDIVVQAVSEGYYALIAVQPPSSLGVAINALRDASTQLKVEMA